MTSSTMNDTTTATDTPSRTPLLIALGVATSAVLTAVGTFWGENTTGDASRDDVSTWLICVAIAVVTAAVAFGLGVRAAAGGNAGRRSAILGVLAFLSLAAFWSGVPAVLAAASVACALLQRDTAPSFNAMARAGIALSALATAAAVVLAIVG